MAEQVGPEVQAALRAGVAAEPHHRERQGERGVLLEPAEAEVSSEPQALPELRVVPAREEAAERSAHQHLAQAAREVGVQAHWKPPGQQEQAAQAERW